METIKKLDEELWEAEKFFIDYTPRTVIMPRDVFQNILREDKNLTFLRQKSRMKISHPTKEIIEETIFFYKEHRIIISEKVLENEFIIID